MLISLEKLVVGYSSYLSFLMKLNEQLNRNIIFLGLYSRSPEPEAYYPE
jgi:hypothetical protein